LLALTENATAKDAIGAGAETPERCFRQDRANQNQPRFHKDCGPMSQTVFAHQDSSADAVDAILASLALEALAPKTAAGLSDIEASRRHSRNSRPALPRS
jgi:hypothetical protein